MDTKKLDKWADLLLDTGKRNNLINFKDTKASTAEVLIPSPEILFEKIDGAATFEIFDPKIDNDDEAEESNIFGQMKLEVLEEQEESSDSRIAFLNQFSGKIKRQNQLLVYSTVNPITAVRNINKKARNFLEETGVNVAYMAFGFVHWKESDTSNCFFKAPILLVPILLEQASATEPYTIKSTEDDIIVNPTFAYKLDTEYGVKFPEYTDEGLNDYLEKVRKLVSKLQWYVTDDCKIGIFSFLKINMYRDLKDNAAAILSNQNVRLLMGEQPYSESVSDNLETSPSTIDPLIELHSVVDADSSQIEAIEMAKSGKSFVLQGPPGTGKSQTITNIIAECLHDGKKVLFVSEKLAALNVVSDKLKQAGLSEFCLELHSHKANKKEVIYDICRTLRTNKSSVSSKAEAEIAVKSKAKQQLDAYAAELHLQRPIIEKSLYQLYEAYSALRSKPNIEWPVPQLESKGNKYITETALLLEQYTEYIPSVGYDYRTNPWYGFVGQDISYKSKATLKDSFSVVLQILDKLIPLQQEISRKYEINCASIEDAFNWGNFFNFAETSGILTSSLLNKVILNEAEITLNDLQERSTEILAVRSKLFAIFDESVFELDGAEYKKKLTKEFSELLSRLFNAEYKQLISEIRSCKKDGRKPSYNEAVTMMKLLADYQHLTLEFAEAEISVKDWLGRAYKGVDTDWDYITEQMETLKEILSSDVSYGKLNNNFDFDSERDHFERYACNLEAALSNDKENAVQTITGCFNADVFNVMTADGASLKSRIMDCLNEMDKLDNWCHFRALLSELNEKQVIPFIWAVIKNNVEPRNIVGTFQKLFYYQWIDSILSEVPVLSAFTRISQEKAVHTFTEKDVEQFEISKAKIRAELSAKRPTLDMIAQGSALAVLFREGEKKRKQKSIRTLLSETGELIQRVKPCFLMSPLSVSTFLAPDSVHFDLVVFDEASQIFPQDAIGAIYRAKQLIVVGDSKQMPPSNFFNASLDSDDSDEEIGDVTDFESILDLCSTSLQQLRLRWHYRSRYEQLITFSNKNFYDNDLVTFPSSKADSPGVGVDYYHVDGVFDRKAHINRKEAEYIVDLIYENIEKYPNRSLGVVAFSVAQQDLIDLLLSKRRQSVPEKEFFFNKEVREPFFVKNLETVQGDERDTIIFSVAYGIDAQGRLLHNFGPLNRIGGERRLNVAVTRAKYNVQLVSSMHYTDIDLKRTHAEGARLLREYLDFAENGETALERSVNVSSFEQFDSDFELEVCDFLRGRGFSVDTQVGCSGFKIDLGLKKPNSSDYILAIECDGATYHSSKNARDRDRLRQEILERMGWKFYRIWSTDWFRNKPIEQQYLLEAANEAIRTPENQVRIQPECKVQENYEQEVTEKGFEFDPYKVADINLCFQRNRYLDFKKIIKEILEIEAPLSEELLLKRIVWFFDREKVTNVVLQAFEQKMQSCWSYGIIRRNGFLYLDNGKEIRFRVPGDIERDVKQISPEELAAGMLEIIRQNVSVDKNGLYRSLAALCGVTRVGRAVNDCMDTALKLLIKQNLVTIDDETVSLIESE